MGNKYSTVILWIVVFVAIALASALVVYELRFDLASTLGVEAKALRLELLKVLWQFLLIAVLGGALGLFFKGQEREAQARKDGERKAEEVRAARREALLSTRAQLVEAYHQAKSVRRLLRALAIDRSNDGEFVLRGEYINLMRQLNDVQLRLEYYAELVESNRHIFGGSYSIVQNLGRAESYLNGIVKEFEEASRVFASGERAPVEEFPRLKEFVSYFLEGSPFSTEFKETFDIALRAFETEANKAWATEAAPNPGLAADA